MALAPFRMATSERYEHCIVHTVFEHYIVLFNFVVLTLSEYVSLYLNIDVVFYVWILIVHDNKRLKHVSFFYYTHVNKSKTSNQTRQKRASSAKSDSLSAKEADSAKLGNDEWPLGLPRALGLGARPRD